ncbi:cupin domain-containing protein [Polymorphum gilvum]|uniref:Hypothetical conserved protein n=1 Tax=Polymorphum gilvum (strain LMG 25793 / CGMCC 1.9160 / SL003B-26A1) TaxID=991905 RepID=F2J2Z6_POLGS|nr:cupin domain-containing protein [Polymorphum gilvum]ADZ68866.1 Hypothetical conserved protein [Polymorphum gilvum SL003B-26A1]
MAIVSRNLAGLFVGLGFTPVAEDVDASAQASRFPFTELDKAKLKPAPIRPEWILEGEPQARAASLSVGTNGWAGTDHWDCTAGRFRWHFGWDETVLFLEGCVVITGDDGTVYQGKPGVSILFPAGTRATWHVPTYVRKIAFNRRPMPKLVSLALKVQSRLDRLRG